MLTRCVTLFGFVRGGLTKRRNRPPRAMDRMWASVLLAADPTSLARFACTSHAMRQLAKSAVADRRADLSGGSEAVAVTCENVVDGEPFPAAKYSPSAFGGDPRLSEAATEGCVCEGECQGTTCRCCAVAPLAYDEHRRLRSLVPSQGLVVRASAFRGWETPIFECGAECRCPSSCPNRVVSQGLRTPLSVFKTVDRGWGVRTQDTLRRGQFVCEYAGELISSAEVSRRHDERRGRANYQMSVVEHSSNGLMLRTNLDPTACGNVGRFINHSCQPNLTTALVRAGSFVPRVAFFCLRDIDAGEELTFYYGDGEHLGPSGSSRDVLRRQMSRVEEGRRRCLCGAPDCIEYLPHDLSLEEYA
jgi:histone-lysine N-methyltransferase SETMAR